jgi:hypothetical protein
MNSLLTAKLFYTLLVQVSIESANHVRPAAIAVNITMSSFGSWGTTDVAEAPSVPFSLSASGTSQPSQPFGRKTIAP